MSESAVSVKAKERFCRDCKIPINLFQEPYFMERLKLCDSLYDSMRKWEQFLSEFSKYSNEQDYFEDYNRVKDTAINDIKSTAAYQQFNNCDMNQYGVKTSIPKGDIYKPSNVGREFISVDMRKANFSALRHYDASIFFGAKTWEDFIGRYTNNKHIIESKYIRQVIMGNCNPKRHVTYEKYLMNSALCGIVGYGVPLATVKSFSDDEIVFDITETASAVLGTMAQIREAISGVGVPFRVQHFKLHKIEGTDGYYKEIHDGNKTSLELKCVDSFSLPFILRKFAGEEVDDSDKVFFHNGLMAMYIDVPEIKLN